MEIIRGQTCKTKMRYRGCLSVKKSGSVAVEFCVMRHCSNLGAGHVGSAKVDVSNFSTALETMVYRMVNLAFGGTSTTLHVCAGWLKREEGLDTWNSFRCPPHILTTSFLSKVSCSPQAVKSPLQEPPRKFNVLGKILVSLLAVL